MECIGNVAAQNGFIGMADKAVLRGRIFEGKRLKIVQNETRLRSREALPYSDRAFNGVEDP